MNKWSDHKSATTSLERDISKPANAIERAYCASSAGQVLEIGDNAVRAWRTTLPVLGVGFVALFVLFSSTATQIAQTWWGNDAYNHGLFILPISLFLVWRLRHKLARIAPQPTIWGVGAMAAAAFGWLFGNVAGVLVVEQFSLVFMLQAFILSVVGWRVARAALFPIFFLVFAVPFGEFLIPPLQDFTALFTVRALQLTGIPVFLEGLYIQIPAATFEVAAACSGSRFLITSVTLGALVANQFYHQTWRRVLFIALAILVPIIANGFRAYGLVMIAHLSDLELAVGADHVTFGLIFLSIVIVLLLLAGSLFREKTLPAGATTSPVSALGSVTTKSVRSPARPRPMRRSSKSAG
jgi:exosortase A